MAPLGIIAGLGDLPVQVAAAATERGQGVYILRLKGFVEPALSDYPGEVAGIAEIGKAFKAFKKAGCEEICFAGIVKRPDLLALTPDLRGVGLLPGAIAAAKQGDDALLRYLIGVFEREGFKVIGADEAVQSLTGQAGLLAGPAPSEADMDDLKRAAKVAAQLGQLDIGQGAIVANGLVLCVEAQEGTDQMLQRCATLPVEIRGTPGARRGVLVKRPKPGQERRIDLPTIGLQTIDLAADAGLAGVAFEADGALLLDVDDLKSRAGALGLFVYGFKETEMT